MKEIKYSNYHKKENYILINDLIKIQKISINFATLCIND